MTELGTESGRIDKEQRTWAMACHLSPFVGLLFGGIGAIIAPLVIWLIKKDDMPFVDEQGKEVLNFQITIAIAAIISSALIIVVVGILMLMVLGVYYVVMLIVAAIRTNDGEHFRYPFTLRLIT